MKKILLLNPPLFFKNGIPKSLDVSVPPLGLLYLATYINCKAKKMFQAEIIDIAKENISLPNLIKKIKEIKPFVIGISSMTPQLQGTIELAENIKKISPKLTIFIGGSHVSADTNFIKRHSKLFDFAIAGEGEITFLDSLYKIINKQKIPIFQQSIIPKNLDEIPIPDKKLIKRQKYNKTESIIFSRGCPFKCYYCSRPAISKTVRYRSVDNLLKEIEMCLPLCHGYFNFQDDTFTLNRQKVV